MFCYAKLSGHELNQVCCSFFFTLFVVVVIIVYVLRTSKCGLLLHCSSFCSRQNKNTSKACIKYVKDNTDTRREENTKCGTNLIGLIAVVSGSQRALTLLKSSEHMWDFGDGIFQTFVVNILQVRE